MVDYAKTITNTFQVFGPGPTSLWGTMVWGVDEWGGGNDQLASAHKILSESLSLSDSWIKDAVITRSDSLSITSSIPDLTSVDAAGYYHVFISNVTDAADRAITTWTDESDPSSDWSEVSEASTTWS